MPCRVPRGAVLYWASGAAFGTLFHTGAFMQNILETTRPSENELIGKTSDIVKRPDCSV